MTLRSPADATNWTDYLALKGRDQGINRQCSIGWHAECSDPEGEKCACHCHPQSEWPEGD